MFWRWILAIALFACSLLFLQLAGAMLFGADEPDDYYAEPGIKQKLIFWCFAYGIMAVGSFMASVVTLVLNIRRMRKANLSHKPQAEP